MDTEPKTKDVYPILPTPNPPVVEILSKEKIALQEAIKQINEKKEKDIKNIQSTKRKNRERKKKEIEDEAETQVMKKTLECQGNRLSIMDNQLFNIDNFKQKLSLLYSLQLGNLFVEYWKKQNLFTRALAELHIDFDNIGDFMRAANPTSNMYNPHVRNWLETICKAHGWDVTQLLQVHEHLRIFYNQLVQTECHANFSAQAIGALSDVNSRKILAAMFKELFHVDWAMWEDPSQAWKWHA